MPPGPPRRPPGRGDRHRRHPRLVGRGPRGLYRPRKQAITTRLDADLIAHFKAAGGPYQTAINRALREWLREHGKPHAAS